MGVGGKGCTGFTRDVTEGKAMSKVTHNVTLLYGSLEYPDHPTTFSEFEADRI